MRMYVNDRLRTLFHKGNKIASVGRSADFHTSSETLSDAGVMTWLQKEKRKMRDVTYPR